MLKKTSCYDDENDDTDADDNYEDGDKKHLMFGIFEFCLIIGLHTPYHHSTCTPHTLYSKNL